VAAIPCPQCKRILNLPDDREIEAVSCPMCKHTFAPPSTPKIIPASIPVPTIRIPLQFVPDDPSLPSMPLKGIEEDEDYPVRPYKDEDEKALESAGRFLKTMGWLGLAHTLPCWGCMGYVASNQGISWGGASGMEEFFVFLCISVVAYTFILIGARALQLQSSFGLAVMGVAVALLSTSALILVNVPLVLSFFDIWTGPVPIMGRPDCGGLLMVPSILVIVCGMVGGIKGMLALLKPDARERFFPGGERSFTGRKDWPRGKRD
jgi:hypothetical protein